MKKRDEIYRLASIVKYFDVNFISNEDCNKIADLDGNFSDGASCAIRLLVVDGFSRYLPHVRVELINLLKKCLADEKEDFSRLFSEIEMAFQTEVENKRHFMQVLLKELEPYAVPEK